MANENAGWEGRWSRILFMAGAFYIDGARKSVLVYLNDVHGTKQTMNTNREKTENWMPILFELN